MEINYFTTTLQMLKKKFLQKLLNSKHRNFSSKLALKKVFFNNTVYFLRWRLRMQNPFLAVGIGKPFIFWHNQIYKKKMKISCSITNLTENNLTKRKFKQNWWNYNLFLVRLKLWSHISRNCGNIACPIPFSDCNLSLIHYFLNSKNRCDRQN